MISDPWPPKYISIISISSTCIILCNCGLVEFLPRRAWGSVPNVSPRIARNPDLMRATCKILGHDKLLLEVEDDIYLHDGKNDKKDEAE